MPPLFYFHRAALLLSRSTPLHFHRQRDHVTSKIGRRGRSREYGLWRNWWRPPTTTGRNTPVLRQIFGPRRRPNFGRGGGAMPKASSAHRRRHGVRSEHGRRLLLSPPVVTWPRRAGTTETTPTSLTEICSVTLVGGLVFLFFFFSPSLSLSRLLLPFFPFLPYFLEVRPFSLNSGTGHVGAL